MLLTKQIDDAFTNFRTAINESVNLDVKTKQLIALANAAIIDCQPCVATAYKSALEAGATPGEIAEAIALAMVVAGGKIKIKTSETIAGLSDR
jgi:AhpD family alkylhydroperoxidase